jgi:hypothetical protein
MDSLVLYKDEKDLIFTLFRSERENCSGLKAKRDQPTGRNGPQDL